MPAGSILHSALLSTLPERTCFTAVPQDGAATSPHDAQVPDDVPDDPLAGGEGRSKGQLAREYPVPGVINDIASKKYLVDPSYWVSWGRPENPGSLTRTGIPSPPAVWWEQRERWRDEWPRLHSGKEGNAFLWTGRRRPRPKKMTKDLLFGGTNPWWQWLEGREKPGTEPKANVDVEEPKDLNTGENEGTKERNKRCPRLFEDPRRAKEPVPGCWCPGPRCINKDQGFFGGVAPEQLAWVNENMMRRQTLPGRSDALSFKPGSLRHASVRLSRMQDGNGAKASTLDPRPPQPVGNATMPGMAAIDKPRLEPYETGGMLGALAKKAGNTAMEGAFGGSLLEMKAYKRLMETRPEWLPNLIKSQKEQHERLAEEEQIINRNAAAIKIQDKAREKQLKDAARTKIQRQAQPNEEAAKEEPKADAVEEEAREESKKGATEEEALVERAKKRGMKELMEKPPEPAWVAPPPQAFKDLYELRYRKFWPAMEVLARRQGSGPAQLIDELGDEWRSARVAPPKIPNAIDVISESAGADVRAARAALGGAEGRETEDIEAVDQVLPVPLPQTLQARPKDLGNIPTPAPPDAAKAYLAKEAPPQTHSEAAQKTVDMYPAGKDGHGVSAKVTPSVVAMLKPEEATKAQAGIGPVGATAGAALLARTWDEVQLLTREAHLARWCSAHPRGRRRLRACAASFL